MDGKNRLSEEEIVKEAYQQAWVELKDVPLRFIPVAAGALIEDKLNTLIGLRLIESKFAKELIKEGYAKKVKICVATGILEPFQAELLMSFSDVRNHFAHDPRAQITDERVSKTIDKFVNRMSFDSLKSEDLEGKSPDEFKAEWRKSIGAHPSQASLILKIVYAELFAHLTAAEFLLTKLKRNRLKTIWLTKDSS